VTQPRMALRAVGVAAVCVLTVSRCGGGSRPSTPVSPSTDSPIAITGSEKISWLEPAQSLSDAQSLNYSLYVDGSRTPLTATTCVAGASAGAFDCSSPLPPLVNGQHQLQLSATDSLGNESSLSPALAVVVTRL
jgi:hypothetical protein